MTQVHENRWFNKLLSLVGSAVAVHTVDGRKLSGNVRNASFDCFLLNVNSDVVIIRYCDVLSLQVGG